MQIYNELNPQQRDAVEHIEGPLLILAGAGSGKTKVITYRISHLIKKGHASPENILALTFTNKAADEMRNRVEKIIGLNGLNRASGCWISTFHSACVRILRRDIDKLGFGRDFVIYDANDSLSLLKGCMKELNISDDLYPPKSIAGRISNLKNELIEKIQNPEDGLQEIINTVYTFYQRRLKENNALDFDDLLMKTVLLFENVPDVLKNYKERFKYLMVDEYQDTNHAQYRLVQILSSGHRNICVVGDDDQCIYQWRGATIRNIMEFERDYPDVKVVKLEENYRSTQNILDAAWAVVSRNLYRKEKKLWTKKSGGGKIFYHRASNEIDEADFITSKIKELCRESRISYSDVAIFYRTNAQSRVLEDSLRREGISYKIYGGLKFFERKEVKDILCYLKIVINPNDSISLKRIINVPVRGIGNATVDKIEQYAKSKGVNLIEAIKELRGQGVKGSRGQGIEAFYNILKKLEAFVTTESASEVIKKTLEISGYLEALKNEKTDEAEDRIENLKELISAAEEYEERTADKSIAGFLDQAALVSDADTISDTSGSVSLMTLHISKGLEFPAVFIAGMEGRIFPHIKSIDSEKEMEEERRLCYVGITRAKERLFLTNAESRRIYGQEMSNPPSEFIEDIPRELINTVDSQQSTVSSQENKKADYAGLRTADSRLLTAYSVGSKVIHPQFGNGIILQKEGLGENLKLTIFFRNAGKKKIAMKHTHLKSI
ncbi:MAG: ATP-dependent DNA helicase PcrA [Nitrospinae bacterium RIFCSPLOWO2_12_39_16]|nr:MAG: ATP-dependent DNA helicase PcrA [Nitrospinae bacterium RIFCSPLOWO2_12_39_16]